LLLVGQKSFCWDSNIKGSDINVNNNVVIEQSSDGLKKASG